MKSKKKLLLMGVGVMGALAMGVGAASTFAWFQVANTGAAKTTSFDKNDIISVKPTGDVAVELPLAVTYTETMSLELAHYFGSTDSPLSDLEGASRYGGGTWTATAGKTYNPAAATPVLQQTATAGLYTAVHLNNASATLQYKDGAINNLTNTLYGVVAVTVKAPENSLGSGSGAYAYEDPDTGVHYTQADIAALLKDKYIDLKVERGADKFVLASGKYISGVTYYTNATGASTVDTSSFTAETDVSTYYVAAKSRAKFYYLGGTNPTTTIREGKESIDTGVSADGADYGYIASKGHKLDDLADAGITLYLGMYIEGVNPTASALDYYPNAVTGDFKITVRAGRSS